MKTKLLLEALKPKDRKRLEELLKQAKKKTFLELYKQIGSTSSENLDREQLFVNIFHKPYKEDKDYLLRNELRLFNQYLRDFIKTLQFEKSLAKPSWDHVQLLLNYYKEHQQYDLFEEDWHEAIKRAEETEDLTQIIGLLRLWVEYINVNKETIPSVYQEAQAYLWKYAKHIDYAAISILIDYRVLTEGIRRMLQALGLPVPNSPKSQVHFDYPITDLFREQQYNWHKAETYKPEHSFESRITHFQAMLPLCEEDDYFKQFALYSNMGVEYFVRSNFEQAYHYYKLAYQLIITHQMLDDRRAVMCLLNYISSAVALNLFEEAIEVYHANEEHLKHEPRVIHNLQRIIAIAYLFLNKTQEAFDFMPHDINERSKNDYYYYRAVYSLGYLLKGDYESANREAENAYRALKATPFEDQSYEKLFLALKHLVDYKSSTEAKEKARKKDAILDYLHQETVIVFHIKNLITSILDSK